MNIRQVIDELEKLSLEVGDETPVEVCNEAGDPGDIEEIEASKTEWGPNYGEPVVRIWG